MVNNNFLMSYQENYLNYGINTASEHIKILNEKGFVLWGNWCKNGDPTKIDTMSFSTYDRYNSCDNMVMFAYSRKNNAPLIQMNVASVLYTKDVKKLGLEDYIPPYYGIDMPCYGYLRVNKITVLDNSQAFHLFSSSGKRISDMISVQASGKAAWSVSISDDENENAIINPQQKIIHNNALYCPDHIKLNRFGRRHGYIYYIHLRNENDNLKLRYVGQTCDFDRRKSEHFNFAYNILHHDENKDDKVLYQLYSDVALIHGLAWLG